MFYSQRYLIKKYLNLLFEEFIEDQKHRDVKIIFQDFSDSRIQGQSYYWCPCCQVSNPRQQKEDGYIHQHELTAKQVLQSKPIFKGKREQAIV